MAILMADLDLVEELELSGDTRDKRAAKEILRLDLIIRDLVDNITRRKNDPRVD